MADADGLSAIVAMVVGQALLTIGVATTDYEAGHRDDASIEVLG